ncbi:MAG: hypothetical protein CFK49_11745 [Armatimonadetes bacterium JP3_11]|jgi:hypothetical protein|nr:MAG: hypothetical protein CFK49_11745 [Armatimonadetes bacterium JP3_11]
MNTPFAQALSELEPILRELEHDRAQQVSQFAQITLWSVVVGGILSLILAVWRAGIWSFVPLGIALIVIIATYASKAEAWRKAFKWRVMTRLVKYFNPNLEYRPDGAISQREYELSMLFHNSPDPDRYHGEDLIEGVIDKTDIRLSELHTEYKQVTYDSKGRRQERWITIFRGLFISADFHKHFHGITLVLPDTEQSWLGGFGQWLQSLSAKLGNQPGELVKMEDPEFERLFKVFSTDQIEARYILTPNMIRRILEFRARTNAPVRLSFIASRVFIAIPTAHNYFEPPSLFAPVNQLLEPETIARYFEELRFALAVVDELNLNTRIWTKQ